MPLALPHLEGVEHTWHGLPTGVRVHLAAAGPEDAPPVLALHGWPSTGGLYRHFLAREIPPALAEGFRDRRLTVPARLLHGTRDPLGRALAEDFLGELELVERTGHFLPEEAPDLVAERIRADLRGGPQAATGCPLSRSRASSRVIDRLPQRAASA